MKPNFYSIIIAAAISSNSFSQKDNHPVIACYTSRRAKGALFFLEPGF